MKIKPGTESGQIYRLRNKGVPYLRGRSRGDQHVHVDVTIPKKLTPRQEELIVELGKEFGDSVEKKHDSIFEKLKHFFE